MFKIHVYHNIYPSDLPQIKTINILKKIHKRSQLFFIYIFSSLLLLELHDDIIGLSNINIRLRGT